MKQLIYISFFIWIFLFSGCSDDFISKEQQNFEEGSGEIVEKYITLKVTDFKISSGNTRNEVTDPDELAKEKASNKEKIIKDIWVFQYGVTSESQLINPAYYNVPDQDALKNLKVLLKDENSIICVVTNTHDPGWGNGEEFKTYNGLMSQKLTTPNPTYLTLNSQTSDADWKGIPMLGEIKTYVGVGDDPIDIPVTRMYAKLKISFPNLMEGMELYSITISHIPNYCRIGSLGNTDTTDPYNYEDNGVTRSFTARTSESGSGNTGNNDGDEEYIIYVPECIKGLTDNTGEKDKNEITPDKNETMVIVLRMRYEENGVNKELEYTIYPGGNTTNNFNICRNCVYRIKVSVNSTDSYSPSSNCFVVIPGEGLSFEPYYRIETGGNYNFSDYLDPFDESEDEDKVIDDVEIIWQTQDAIGDNSDPNNKLVWLESFTEEELIGLSEEDRKEKLFHRRIFVRTSKEGNALIGALNKKKEIIWSWHIWITENDPANEGNACVYTTYQWDKNGIKSGSPRKERYAVMSCNIGALAVSPSEPLKASTVDNWYTTHFRPYGMLFQWGRKDPFPPIKFSNKNSGYIGYNSKVAQAHILLYDNSNKQITMERDNADIFYEGDLFTTFSIEEQQKVEHNNSTRLKYSINHPTRFIAGAKRLDGYNIATFYKINRGDWLPESDECLWGAVPKEGKIHYAAYNQNTDHEWSIWDNYGPEKTIFDPCPKGWRVPPGDLWLGFTVNGLNQHAGSEIALENVNSPSYQTVADINNNNGYWLCLDGWKTELNSQKTNHCFFPTQGSRLADGRPYLAGTCGNYHNATSDATINVSGVQIDRVNILHLHSVSGSSKVNTFEDQLLYYNKSVAGPIRCVREK